MTIYRGHFSFDHFTITPNKWVRDRRLEISDKGLLTYILSHSPDYPLTMEQVVAENKNGYDSINSAMKRLEKAGYLKRTRQRGPDGRLGPYDWFLTDPDESGKNQESSDVSAGRDQSGIPPRGSARLANPGTKKTTYKNTTEEEQTGTEASSGGLRLASEAAPTLPRRRRTKTITRDPRVKDMAADDAKASEIAADYLDEDSIAITTRYMWCVENATTTSGYMRRLAEDGPSGAGIVAKAAVAEDWERRIDRQMEGIPLTLTNSVGFSRASAGRIEARIRYACEIGCTESDVNGAIRGLGMNVDAWLAAVGAVIARREDERKRERIERVQKQKEAAA